MGRHRRSGSISFSNAVAALLLRGRLWAPSPRTPAPRGRGGDCVNPSGPGLLSPRRGVSGRSPSPLGPAVPPPRSAAVAGLGAEGRSGWPSTLPSAGASGPGADPPDAAEPPGPRSTRSARLAVPVARGLAQCPHGLRREAAAALPGLRPRDRTSPQGAPTSRAPRSAGTSRGDTPGPSPSPSACPGLRCRGPGARPEWSAAPPARSHTALNLWDFAKYRCPCRRLRRSSWGPQPRVHVRLVGAEGDGAGVGPGLRRQCGGRAG